MSLNIKLFIIAGSFFCGSLAMAHPCELAFRSPRSPVPGLFDPATQSLKKPRTNLKTLFENRSSTETSIIVFSKEEALALLEPADRAVFEKLIELNPSLNEKFDRLGIIDPFTNEGPVLEIVVKAETLQPGRIQMSTGEWHADRGDSVFIYQKSDPPNLSPTILLSDSKSVNRDALAAVLNGHTGLVHQRDIDLIGALEIEIPSESFVVLRSDTLHRSQRAKVDGRRYFMRITFRMRPPDFHQRFRRDSETIK